MTTRSLKQYHKIDKKIDNPWPDDLKKGGFRQCKRFFCFLCTNLYITWFLNSGLLCLVAIVFLFTETFKNIVPAALVFATICFVLYFIMRFAAEGYDNRINEQIRKVNAGNAKMNKAFHEYGLSNKEMKDELQELKQRQDELKILEDHLSTIAHENGVTQDEIVHHIMSIQNEIDEVLTALNHHMDSMAHIEMMASHLNIQTRYLLWAREAGIHDGKSENSVSMHQWIIFVQKIQPRHMQKFCNAIKKFIRKDKLKAFNRKYQSKKHLTSYALRQIFPMLQKESNGEFSSTYLCKQVVPAMSMRISLGH